MRAETSASRATHSDSGWIVNGETWSVRTDRSMVARSSAQALVDALAGVGWNVDAGDGGAVSVDCCEELVATGMPPQAPTSTQIANRRTASRPVCVWTLISASELFTCRF